MIEEEKMKKLTDDIIDVDGWIENLGLGRRRESLSKGSLVNKQLIITLLNFISKYNSPYFYSPNNNFKFPQIFPKHQFLNSSIL